MISTPSTYILPLLKGNLIAMTADEIKYIRSDGPMVQLW
jgi:hypothetical protein